MSGMIVLRAYFRKARHQILVIAFMLIEAAMIFGLASVLLMDYQDNFFRIHDRLHAEHVVLDYASLTAGGGDFIDQKLSGDQRISEYEITEASFAQGNCQYGEDGLLKSVFALMRMSDAENKSIGKFEITEEAETGDGYIPYIFSANGFYQTGDTFTVKTGGSEKSFIIKGFYNNLTTGTVNCRDVVLLLTDETYEELASEGFTDGWRVSVRLHESKDAEAMESELISELSEAASGIKLIAATNYTKLSKVRYISEVVFAGILCAAAVVIVLVLLAIIAVSLSNYIKENMRNLGIMKAVGYVSRQLSVPVVLSLSLLAVFCSLLGYGLSYCLLPLISHVLECQSGIPYEIRFLPLPGVLTVGISFVSVFVTASLSIAKIRKILPIMAIRPVKSQGDAASVLPLTMAKTGLDMTLGLKTVFSNRRKYFVFFAVSCLTTIMLCVAAYCVDNIFNHPEHVIRMVMGNTADISLSVSASEEESLTKWLTDREDVQNFYVYTHGSVCHEGGDRLDTVVRDEEGNRQSTYLLTEGVLPEKENELAVNFAYAEEKGLEIGDEMVLTKDGSRQSYVICGLFQEALSSGKNVALLREGYEKLEQLSTVSYLVNLTDGSDIDAFVTELSVFRSVSAINYRKFVSGMSAAYISTLNVLITIIVIVSLLIAAMILSVIVNIILYNKRREHGIMKALGYVTQQIIFQTAVSFVPVAVGGAIVGLLISYRGVSRLFSSFVRSIGIASFGDSVSFPYLAACGILFTLFTFIVTCLLSMKAGKIVPHDLFNQE